MTEDFWSLLCCALPVLGHVLYGLQEPNRGRVRLYNGDDFSASDDPPRPERICNLRAVTQEGQTPLPFSEAAGATVAIDTSPVSTRPSWIVAQTMPAHIELAAAKFDAYLAHEGIHHVIAARAGTTAPGREIYSKYIKTALSNEDGSVSFATQAVGFPVEFVPITTVPLCTGQALRVRLLHRDAPAADVQVRVSHRDFDSARPGDDAVLRTDADGEVTLIVSGAGYWRLHSIVMQESESPEADWESWWAAMAFSLER